MKPSLRDIFLENEKWGRLLGVTGVEDLNRLIEKGGIDDHIRAVEAIHDQKLVQLADTVNARPAVRIVFVAGPSSAGKTTFAKRLAGHLRSRGAEPLVLSTDNYFVGDARNPRDEEGRLDYEHVDAMDIPRLDGDLLDLLAGRDVFLRHFDFTRKQGYDSDVPTRLPPGGIVVMEGLHCLNPRLSEHLPAETLFRIYINAVTQLDATDGGRISTTDNRLLRRIVRDNQFRNLRALDTLRLWPSVRRGEERWIFPFEDHADTAFNSALGYEFAVLKPLADPLLREIDPATPEGKTAARLLDFLEDFRTLPPIDAIPGNSILREYIGGSSLDY
ncbi:MAG: nucleoside kinase [Kiritimatiellia bacterium]|jgi:uridine kinase